MTDPNGILIVIVLLILIVVGSNLVMFGMVRGSRDMKFNWFKNLSNPYDELMGKEEKDSRELSKKLQEIKNNDAKSDEED